MEPTDMEPTDKQLIKTLQNPPTDEAITIKDVECDNLSGDCWEDTQEGMRYYGREYDPVTDEWV